MRIPDWQPSLQFLLLQDAHTRLATKLESTDIIGEFKAMRKLLIDTISKSNENSSRNDTRVRHDAVPTNRASDKLLESIHTTLVNYLPLNIDDNLQELIQLAKAQSHSAKFTSVPSTGSSQNQANGLQATIVNSLDSIQHTLSRIVDCIDHMGAFGNEQISNNIVDVTGHDINELEISQKAMR